VCASAILWLAFSHARAPAQASASVACCSLLLLPPPSHTVRTSSCHSPVRRGSRPQWPPPSWPSRPQWHTRWRRCDCDDAADGRESHDGGETTQARRERRGGRERADEMRRRRRRCDCDDAADRARRVVAIAPPPSPSPSSARADDGGGDGGGAVATTRPMMREPRRWRDDARAA